MRGRVAKRLRQDVGPGAGGGVQSAGLAAGWCWLELYAGLTPSPPSVGDEAIHIEGGLLFENEVGGTTELCGQNAQSLALGMFLSEALEIVLSGLVVVEEADGGLTEGPFEVDVSDLVAGGAGFLSVRFFAALDEARIGREGLDGGEAGDVTDLVEQREAENLAHAADGSEAAEVVRIMDVGLAEDGALELRDEAVIVVDEGEIGVEVCPNGRIVEEFGQPFPVSRTGQTPVRPGPVVLGKGVLNMCEELGPFPSEVKTASQEVSGGAHEGRIDVGKGKSSGAQEDGDLLGVDPVILGLSAMDGLQWMAFM